MARKIYHSSILRQRLVNLCPVLYRPVMDSILFNDLVVILRLMSCDYQLLPSKIGEALSLYLADFLERSIILFSEELCKQQMKLLVVHVGEWVKFPETIHELYAHLPEMIGKFMIAFRSARGIY